MKVQLPSNTGISNMCVSDTIRNRQHVSVESKIKCSIPVHSKERMSSMIAKPQETASQQNEEIRIELIEEKDSIAVLNMLKEFFFKDEPMNTFLELGECKELEEYSLKSLSDKCSFKAVNENGEIVGVAMNGIVKKPATQEPFHSYAADCKHPKFKIILSLMEYIDQHFNLFDLYPNINEYLDARIISVNTNYRGCGIAGKLMERTIQYMRDHQMKIIHVMCSSFYSARVCEKMNFKKVYQLPFVNYVVNGENPIRPEAPHQAVQILVQEIQ